MGEVKSGKKKIFSSRFFHLGHTNVWIFNKNLEFFESRVHILYARNRRINFQNKIFTFVKPKARQHQVSRRNRYLSFLLGNLEPIKICAVTCVVSDNNIIMYIFSTYALIIRKIRNIMNY